MTCRYILNDGSGWGSIDDIDDVCDVGYGATLALEGSNTPVIVGVVESEVVTTYLMFTKKPPGEDWLPAVEILDSGISYDYPILLYAEFPSGNIPATDYYFVCSVDVGILGQDDIWFFGPAPVARKWKGNILIDQLIYQHAERMVR